MLLHTDLSGIIHSEVICFKAQLITWIVQVRKYPAGQVSKLKQMC